MPVSKEKCIINGREYFRACAIAESLGLSEWFLIKLGNSGKVPSLKMGRCRWFNYNDVLAARITDIPKDSKYAALDGI